MKNKNTKLKIKTNEILEVQSINFARKCEKKSKESGITLQEE